MHWILLITLALLWGPSFLIIKIGLKEIPPLTLAAGRVGIAAVVVYGLMRLKGNTFPRSFQFWKRFAIMGLLSNALPFALLMIGETKAPSAIAAIFTGFTPVATALIAHFTIDEERLSRKTLIGILLGFAGILLLFIPAIEEGIEGNELLIGMLCFTVIAISYGFSMVYSRVALRGHPEFVGPAAQMIAATVFLLPVSLAAEWNEITLPGIESLGAVIWLGVIATAIAYIVYYRLLEIAGATFLSLVTFLLPPLGVAFGVVFLDEHLGWNVLLGCAVILFGVRFVQNVGGKT